MSVDVRKLKQFDRIKNTGEGFLNGEVGIVNWCNGEIAVATFIKTAEFPYTIGIWNANEIELLED